MTALKRELKKRGIVGYSDYYETSQKLVCFTNDFIVILYECIVIDPHYIIYDAKTLIPLCEETVSRVKERDFDGTYKNPHNVWFYE